MRAMFTSDDGHALPLDDEDEQLLDDLEELLALGIGDAAEQAEVREVLAVLRPKEKML